MSFAGYTTFALDIANSSPALLICNPLSSSACHICGFLSTSIAMLEQVCSFKSALCRRRLQIPQSQTRRLIHHA